MKPRALLFSAVLFLLSPSIGRADESRLGLLLYGGAHLTNHGLTPVSTNVTVPSSPSVYSSTFGIGGHYRLDEEWAFELDAFFARSAFSNILITGFGNAVAETSGMWLYAPALLKYFPLGPVLELGIGAYFGFLLELTNVAALPATSTAGAQTTISDTNSLSTYSKFDFGPVASLGANLPVAAGINVIANFTFQYGLVNLINSYDTLYSSYSRWIIGGLLGLRLNWEIKSH